MIRRALRKLTFIARRTRIQSFNALKKVSPYEGLTRERIASERQWLTPHYETYVNSVSRADMALSLETAACMSAIAKLIHAKRILDMGSGFSSFVLRTYAAGSGATVTSVDDDPKWLGKTEQFLASQGLTTADMIPLSAFLDAPKQTFDLIVFDLNFVEVRIRYVVDVVRCLAPGGIIFFDDVHKIDYLMELLQLTAKMPLRLFDLKPVTLDRFARYTMAGLKTEA